MAGDLFSGSYNHQLSALAINIILRAQKVKRFNKIFCIIKPPYFCKVVFLSRLIAHCRSAIFGLLLRKPFILQLFYKPAA